MNDGLIQKIDMRFQSGNSVDVDSVRISEEEWAQLKAKHNALLAKLRLSNRTIHNMVVANQAAWIEWQHGKGSANGMMWIHNGLLGPGMIPDENAENGKNAQRWHDANVIN